MSTVSQSSILITISKRPKLKVIRRKRNFFNIGLIKILRSARVKLQIINASFVPKKATPGINVIASHRDKQATRI